MRESHGIEERVHCAKDAVSLEKSGSKVAARYDLRVASGETVVTCLRLSDADISSQKNNL
jgi:hypothetical protein